MLKPCSDLCGQYKLIKEGERTACIAKAEEKSPIAIWTSCTHSFGVTIAREKERSNIIDYNCLILADLAEEVEEEDMMRVRQLKL